VQSPGSKGPAYDGRIKPELVAFGEDGSSGASALVSGSALLVQQAFRRVNGNTLPDASLVKAALINAADDAGAPLPDYLTGFGNLNTFKAVQSALQGRFFGGTVAQDETRTYSINIPSGITRVKVTLAWTDPAAAPNAAKALVNDLDLRLLRPASGESWLPWVLNHAPHPDSLQQAAKRKKDTLNNVEQVTLDAPPSGNYTIEVKGSKLTGTQSFSIVYELDTAASFYWTYPTATHPLVSGNTHYIRWETPMTGPGQLEYTFDGTNWKSIAAIPDLSRKYYHWTVPDTLSVARLRMRLGTADALSDTFAISPELNLQLGFECVDSFLIYWNKIPVQLYEVAELREKYMEPFVQTADTAVLLYVAQHPSAYYGVTPIVGNRKGNRSNSLNRVQGLACYVNSFYVQSQTQQEAFLVGELGTLFRVSEVSLQKLTASGFVTISTVRNPTTTSFRFNDPNLVQGENTYRMKVVLIYPNPTPQSQNLRILTNESGRYTAYLFDGQGRMLWSKLITSTLTLFPSINLSKGVYYIRFDDRDGKPFTEKVVIY
jgi:hypothetical protein